MVFNIIQLLADMLALLYDVKFCPVVVLVIAVADVNIVLPVNVISELQTGLMVTDGDPEPFTTACILVTVIASNV